MAQQASQAGGVFGLECRAIVPNGSSRRSSGGVLGFSAVALAGYGALRLRSIGDNRSTMARKRRRFSVSFLTSRIIAAECGRAAQKRL